MKPKIIFGPAVNENVFRKIASFRPAFYVLDFTPFQQDCATEASAKKVRRQLSEETGLIAVFSGNPVNQILYLLTEDIADIAFCFNYGERDLLRIAETAQKPLIRAVETSEPAAIRRAAGQTGTYLYFPEKPGRDLLKTLSKPYILQASPDEWNHEKMNDEPNLFALWYKDIPCQ